MPAVYKSDHALTYICTLLLWKMNDGEDTSQNGLRHHHDHLLYCITLGIVLFVDVQCSSDINHLAWSLTVIWLTVLLTYITGLGWQGSPPPTPRLHPERVTHIHTINQDVRISIICRVRRSIDALINVLFSYVCRRVYLDYRSQFVMIGTNNSYSLALCPLNCRFFHIGLYCNASFAVNNVFNRPSRVRPALHVYVKYT